MCQGLREGGGRAACGASACCLPGSSPSCHPTERWPCQGKGKGHPFLPGVPVQVATLARIWPKRHVDVLVALPIWSSPVWSWRCWLSWGAQLRCPLLCLGKGGSCPLPQVKPQGTGRGQQGSLSLEPGAKQGGIGGEERVTSLLSQLWVQQVSSSTSNTSHNLEMRAGKKHRAAFPHHIPQHAAIRDLGMA